MFNSVTALSKSMPSTAPDHLPLSTAACTTPSRWRRLRPYRPHRIHTRALFVSQQNHACKLEHAGDKLNDNPSEERPERAEEGRVVQLQQVCCYSDGSEQIKNEPRERLRLYLPESQATKVHRDGNGKQKGKA